MNKIYRNTVVAPKFEKVSKETYDRTINFFSEKLPKAKLVEYDDIKLPKRSSQCSAGYDFYNTIDLEFEIPDEDYSIEAINKAHDFGCTFFDTAEVYGPNLEPEFFGHNEKLLAKALKPYRKEIVLATKLHVPTEEAKNDKDVYKTLRRHLEASLKRLQTDYVDIYYLKG